MKFEPIENANLLFRVKTFRSSNKNHERWNFTCDEIFVGSLLTNQKNYGRKTIFSQSCSVEKFILDQENKSTQQKTRRDVHLLESFLRTKSEERKTEQIPATEFNKYISEFIMSVRTKDGKEYEPTSL